LIILGIDPGLSGGLAFVGGLPGEQPRLLDVIDVPVIGEKAKRRVDPAVLSFIRRHKADHAYIERAQAMPDQGASSGFNYGRAVGALEMAVCGCLVPLTPIESTAWKKAHGLLKREKEDSRQRAIQLFPGNRKPFDRKMDHNRAEAALIAWFGWMLSVHGRAAPVPPIAEAASRTLL
jgi:crossover junction endodeoxyribonuclease RuvC